MAARLVCSVLVLSLASPPAAIAQPRSADVVVEARLVEGPARRQRCGRARHVYVFRYEVVRVVSGEAPAPGEPLFVAHACPEALTTGFGRGLVVGSEYRLELSLEPPARWPAPRGGVEAGEARRFYALAARWLRIGSVREPPPRGPDPSLASS